MRFGCKVRLKSGGPICLVVDLLPDGRVVIAWPGGETSLPLACLVAV